MYHAKKLLTLALAAISATQLTYADSPLENSGAINKTETYGASSVNYMGVPLNAYGAVSSSAEVPLNIQVPPEPPGLKLAPVIPATTLWKDAVVQASMLNVNSYIVIDEKTGNVLAAKDANKRIPPASLTKMMLLYITEERLAQGTLKLDQVVTVPAIAWHTSGSSMHLKAGQKVTIQDLIEGTIVASGNDASVALSMAIAGTQEGFVNIMNFTAKKLGMRNTHFSNVMGLPAPNLYTSARDLAVLAEHLIQDYPQYYHYFKMKTVKMNGFVTHNYNKLLFIYPYADGIKTGSTASAGYSLVASAVKPDHDRLISVVIGSTSLIQSARDSQALLEYGFSNFKTTTFYPAGYKLDQIRVYKGQEDSVDIGVQTAVTVSYPRYLNPKEIQFVLHKKQSGLIAPVKAGTSAGKLDMMYKNLVKQSFPVVTLKDDPTGSLWQRMKGTVALWF